MIRALRFALGAFVALVAFAAPARAQLATEIPSEARYIVLMDAGSGEIFFQRNADATIPPASMSKTMTLFMLFDAIKAGEIGLDDVFTISTDAWRRGGAATGGSTMFLEPNSEASVRDLIRGVVVASGNDASIAIAENLAGSEAAFAASMNARAEEIGLTGSTFANATGLPDPNHRMTPRDLARLALETLRRHPTLYRFYADDVIEWNGVRQRNRNPILGVPGLGVDGMKTGHTEEAGYCLLASAQRRGRRVILVVGGLESAKARREESQALMQWAFRAFERYPLFEAGEAVTTIPIWHGALRRAPVGLEDDLTLTMSRRARRAMKVGVRYAVPIVAPVRAGDELATLYVTLGDDTLLAERKLIALEDSERLGVFGRAFDTLESVFFGR